MPEDAPHHLIQNRLHSALQLFRRDWRLPSDTNQGIGYLYDLQREIDNRNYAVSISVTNIPRPSRSNAINPVKAAKWVEAHPTERTRRAAQALVDATTHSNQDEFEGGLRKSVNSINPVLAEGGEYAALLIPKRSNQWVTELAMPSLDQLPTQVYDINTLPPEGLSLFRRFVLFDDAGYSGLHMTSMIKQVFSSFQNRGIVPSGLELFVVLPFVTTRTTNRISNSVHFHGCGRAQNSMHFSDYEIMTTLDEKITDPEIKQILRNMYGVNVGNATLTYFDHRIPDGLSCLEAVYRYGKVFNESGKDTKRSVKFIPDTPKPYG